MNRVQLHLRKFGFDFRMQKSLGSIVLEREPPDIQVAVVVAFNVILQLL